MRFIKMHGAGNDYVYVDGFQQTVNQPDKLAPRISHRHFGVGGDGLILIRPWEGGDAEMEMYNSDGSRAEMCGNGLRCVAKYVHDHYRQGKDTLKLLTGAGILEAQIHRGPDGKAQSVTIDMGEPIFEGLRIPTTLDSPRILDRELEAGGRTFRFSSVSMGNPHCIIFVENVAEFPVLEYGPLIENHTLFPKRVNVEFVQIVSPKEAIQRTWERGSGETWACGTGASAVAVVGFHLGKTGSKLTIHLLGGDLLLEYAGEGHVHMTGPAVEVFQGEWPDDTQEGSYAGQKI